MPSKMRYRPTWARTGATPFRRVRRWPPPPDQSGDLLATQLAQFRQVGQQRQGYLFSHAGNAAQQVVLLAPHRTPPYRLAQLGVQVVQFLFQPGDVGLDARANLDRRLEEENINVGLRRLSNLSDDLGVSRGGNRMVEPESLVKITESGKLHDYITRKRRKPRI